MKKTFTLLLLSALPLSGLANQSAEMLEHSQKIFNRSCAMCHGKQGERSALNQSAIINSLKTEEIITALEKRKAGEIVGAGNAAKSRLSENDIKSLAEYIPSLKP
ncbi:c-type cytochrome [Avibacterium avium]|uniref:c-type cytochrome n=1 Tax=Avibacterium avium TaxID=751 RepID=UPI003BF81C5E